MIFDIRDNKKAVEFIVATRILQHIFFLVLGRPALNVDELNFIEPDLFVVIIGPGNTRRRYSPKAGDQSIFGVLGNFLGIGRFIVSPFFADLRRNVLKPTGIWPDPATSIVKPSLITTPTTASLKKIVKKNGNQESNVILLAFFAVLGVLFIIK